MPRESDLFYMLNNFAHLFPFAKRTPRLSLTATRLPELPTAAAAAAGAAIASATAPHSVRLVSASALSSALAAVSTRSYATRGPKRVQTSVSSASSTAATQAFGSIANASASGDAGGVSAATFQTASSSSFGTACTTSSSSAALPSTDQLVPQEEHKAHEALVAPTAFNANNSAVTSTQTQQGSSTWLQPPSSLRPPLVGLVNYTSAGCLQICYANTAIQILFHCRKCVHDVLFFCLLFYLYLNALAVLRVCIRTYIYHILVQYCI